VKKIGFFGKIFYFLNIVFGLLLFISYFIPLIQPGTIPLIAIFSLFMPVLMIVNALFVVFWIFKLNIRFLLSLIVLALGINNIDNFFRWPNSITVGSSDIKVMTYNVRMFDVFDWVKEPNTTQGIYDLVKSESPDVIAFQEYHPMKKFDIGEYEYNYIHYPSIREYWGQAIYSRGKVKSLVSRIDKGFGRHGTQADMLREHIDQSPYPVIVMGDFNSSAFSYEYKQIKGDLVDAFERGGQGFGKTFVFPYFPLRIDFIMGDPNFRLVEFNTLNKRVLSDHYPVTASYKIK